MGRGQDSGKGSGRGADSKRRGDSYWRKSTRGASVLRLGGSAVPSLGGGAMNLASLLSGGGLQTQIHPLASVLGGTTGLLGTSGALNEVECGAGPVVRGGSWGTQRRVEFAIDDGSSLEHEHEWRNHRTQEGRERKQTRHELVSLLAYSHELRTESGECQAPQGDWFA